MPVFNPSISLYKKPKYYAFWYDANLDLVREFHIPAENIHFQKLSGILIFQGKKFC